MPRVILVLLMIGGLLACPLVCMERSNCGACASACAGQRAHEPDASAACCAEPCRDGEDSGSRDRAPDPCQQHGCVCNGAVEARHDPGLDLSPAGAVLCCFAVAVPEADCPEVELLLRCGGGPSFAPLESGRAIRLVFESLLL